MKGLLEVDVTALRELMRNRSTNQVTRFETSFILFQGCFQPSHKSAGDINAWTSHRARIRRGFCGGRVLQLVLEEYSQKRLTPQPGLTLEESLEASVTAQLNEVRENVSKVRATWVLDLHLSALIRRYSEAMDRNC